MLFSLLFTVTAFAVGGGSVPQALEAYHKEPANTKAKVRDCVQTCSENSRAEGGRKALKQLLDQCLAAAKKEKQLEKNCAERFVDVKAAYSSFEIYACNELCMVKDATAARNSGGR